MRKSLSVGLLTTLIVLANVSVALASEGHDGGEGTWGETNDKVITNAGFILIAAFPAIIFIASMIQMTLDKRKDARKKAAKARIARADQRGGW